MGDTLNLKDSRWRDPPSVFHHQEIVRSAADGKRDDISELPRQISFYLKKN